MSPVGCGSDIISAQREFSVVKGDRRDFEEGPSYGSRAKTHRPAGAGNFRDSPPLYRSDGNAADYGRRADPGQLHQRDDQADRKARGSRQAPVRSGAGDYGRGRTDAVPSDARIAPGNIRRALF